jgi:MSHA biogenesis protein MshJ
MVQVLEHLLDTHKAITLEEIENLPVIALSFVDTEAREKDPAADVVKPIPEGPLYRHGMRVTLKGRYFDLVRYLASVEQLDLQIYWDRVTLDARTYPVARVTLELHTISADEAWFEV